jgi:uncharacterized protein (TIGR04255 family)
VKFNPINERHAIAEVVFQLVLDQNFSPKGIQSLIDTHAKWKDDLPRLNVHTPIEIPLLGSEGSGVVSLSGGSPGGVSFEAMKRDGSLEWRLQALGNSLTVNCLDYSRWPEVWARAKSYLQAVSQMICESGVAFRQCLLQYVDIFEWRGPVENYHATSLLKADSRYLPESIWAYGPLWHLHQGWFSLLADGRVLNRINLDGVQVNDDRYQVRIDSYLSIEFRSPIKIADRLAEDWPQVDEIFTKLHGLNKELLSNLIVDEVQQRIGLNA